MTELGMIMTGGAILTAAVFVFLVVCMWRASRKMKREMAENAASLAECKEDLRKSR